MSQKTHYQDDLFILSVLAKALDTSLSVEADPEYFQERIAGDLVFLDSTIRDFGEMLVQNSHLIERTEYVKLLERTARTFTGTVSRLLRGDYPMAGAYSEFAPQLAAIRQRQESTLVELERILKTSGEYESETDLVSSDELSELLKG